MKDVTLVLGVQSRDSLWLLADRRLSYGAGRPPKDDAVKIMGLETTDGVGLLAYAGLGATPRGTQPSEWMSAVLRGRGGLRFEQALAILSDAANQELPRHLARTPSGTHSIVVPAFVRGIGPRLYSIDTAVDPATGKHFYRYTNYQRTTEPGSAPPRLSAAGSGGQFLQEARTWRRPLLRLAQAHDRGKVSGLVIADQLASLNYLAHRDVGDGSVGPRCIVVWRRRRDARRPGPGGGHQFYTGVDREPDSGGIPMISNGLDSQAIVGVLMKQFRRGVDGQPSRPGEAFNLDENEINRLLGELPSEPDNKLR